MCTLVVLHRAHRLYPLVIAANREELLSRASSPPAPLSAVTGGDDVGVVSGVDGAHGGTWMGATAEGLFAGLTNHHDGHPPDPALRSRGQVVVDALRAGTVDRAAALVARLDGSQFNPFNLLLADGATLRIAYARRGQSRVGMATLATGTYALPNDVVDSAAFPRTRAAIGAAGRMLDDDGPALVKGLRTLLSDHGDVAPEGMASSDPTAAVQRYVAHTMCIHTPSYATRSATIALFSADGLSRYLHAAGPPCRHTFDDVTRLAGA